MEIISVVLGKNEDIDPKYYTNSIWLIWDIIFIVKNI